MSREHQESIQEHRARRVGNYDSRSITVLSGPEAIRQSPSMYIGSVGSDGVHHMVFEAVDNSIDESLAGECSRIEVTLENDGSCTVEDDGRGIPVDEHPTVGRPACEVVLTRIHAGGKFKQGSYYRPAGLHGVGISCVNALSEKFVLDVWRDGGHYRQAYGRGVPAADLEKITDSDKRGTRVNFLPDVRIFKSGIGFSRKILARRLEELAFLHPGILIQLKDIRSDSTQVFQFDSGIVGFIKHINESRTVYHKNPIHIQHQDSDFELDLALQWTADYGENVFSYVNTINTTLGGTHVSGVKSALTKAINTYAKETRILDSHSVESISTFEILEGLTCVLSLKMSDPNFEGQTKTRLTSISIREELEKVVTEKLLAIVRDDSKLAVMIVNRALEAMRARLASRRASDRIYFQNLDTDGVHEDVYKRQFGIRSENWHESAVWITDHELLERHVDHLEVGKDARVLDVCCGSGVVGEAFKDKVGTVTGLDLTPQMLDLAKIRLDEVQLGNVYNLPFDDEMFDLVVTREVLHILPYPEKPVSEIFRVLKPGGQFITGQILPYGAEDAVWMYRIFKKKQPLIFNMFQEEDFRQLLLGCGFINLKMTEFTLWESIDVWINTHETSNLHRHEIRELFFNAPKEARAVHPYEIRPDGEIMDLWRWCIFSVRKPER